MSTSWARPIPPDRERLDYAALRAVALGSHEGPVELTPEAREALAKAIDYQDVSRDTWAAAKILEAVTLAIDPVTYVREQLAEVLRLRAGYARWEDRRIPELIAAEREMLGGRGRDAALAAERGLRRQAAEDAEEITDALRRLGL